MKRRAAPTVRVSRPRHPFTGAVLPGRFDLEFDKPLPLITTEPMVQATIWIAPPLVRCTQLPPCGHCHYCRVHREGADYWMTGKR